MSQINQNNGLNRLKWVSRPEWSLFSGLLYLPITYIWESKFILTKSNQCKIFLLLSTIRIQKVHTLYCNVNSSSILSKLFLCFLPPKPLIYSTTNLSLMQFHYLTPSFHKFLWDISYTFYAVTFAVFSFSFSTIQSVPFCMLSFKISKNVINTTIFQPAKAFISMTEEQLDRLFQVVVVMPQQIS